MEDVRNQQSPALSVKRKPDSCFQDQKNNPNKAQKLQSFLSSASEETNGSKHEILDSSAEDKADNKASNSHLKSADDEAHRDENGGGEDHEAAKEIDDEDPWSRAVVDGKGKGILRDDKGKGKLIEEDEDEDDDSSDGGMESDGDSDLSDDPLAEVDLDNILPSRTRRRVMQPGAFISNETGSDEEDDSDDSDA